VIGYQGICFHTPDAIRLAKEDNEHTFKTADGPITGALVTVVSNNQTLSLETDQSYSLIIEAPTILIQANTVFGALNGLESLSQLVLRGVFVNGTTITDAPRYQFRATMIDTSRHYYTLEAILQHLDAMTASKFNVLHWHVKCVLRRPSS
jgi:hexosaminidase